MDIILSNEFQHTVEIGGFFMIDEKAKITTDIFIAGLAIYFSF
jgi:hypothetical protein